MLEIIEAFLRPFFAIGALIYIGLAFRVARSAPEYSSNIISFFLALLGAYVLGAAFSHNATESNIYGVGRVLTFGASGFLPLTFYLIYRQFTIGPPRPIFVAVLSVIPIATTALAMTNSMHNMLWSIFETGDGFRVTAISEHYWFKAVLSPYMYVLAGYSIVALLSRLPSIAVAHQRIVLILIVSAVFPFLVSFGNTVLGLGPLDFPFTALTLLLMLPAFAFVALKIRFYEFGPFAYQTLFDHVRDPIIVIDSFECIVCANESAQELLGASEKELIGQHLWQDFPEARKILHQARDLDLTQTLRLDQESIFELSVQPLTGSQGQNLGMVVVCRDVTERRNAQAQLSESEQLIRTLIETSSNGILRFSRGRDETGTRFRCIFANRAAEAFLGDGSGTLVGMPLDKLTQIKPKKLIEHFNSASDDRSTISLETAAGLADGERWLRIVGEPVGDDFSVTLVDITERKQNEHKMLADALRDPLTGVLNRRGFEKEGGERIRSSSQGAVLYLDLNQFKSINDRFGHRAGDALLKAFGHRLEFCLRPEDVLGRLGGDEFAIVLPGVSVEDAKHVAARLVQTAQEAYIIQGQEIKCTASVGISLMPKHGEELWHLISVADHAMYNAKALDVDDAANDCAAYIEAATAS
ncbi:MAG: diguanylate cyclase [Woeseiaceae bacterium]|nr:diguanylate cyclase [Woeseiaceae bacterium]